MHATDMQIGKLVSSPAVPDHAVLDADPANQRASNTFRCSCKQFVRTEAVCSIQLHQDNSVSFTIKCVALQIKTLHFTHAPSRSDRSWGAERLAGCPGSRGILSSQSSSFDISEHALAAQAAQFRVPRGAAVAGGCGMCTSSARFKIL